MSGSKDTTQHRWTPRVDWLSICRRCGKVYDFRVGDPKDDEPPTYTTYTMPCNVDVDRGPAWDELIMIAAGERAATDAEVRAMALELEGCWRELDAAHRRLMLVDPDLKRYTLLASIAERSDEEDLEARALAEACVRRGITVVPMCDRDPAPPSRRRRSKR